MTKNNFDRYFRAARMIEDDIYGAYYTCKTKFGEEIADVLLVAELRKSLNDNLDQWPPPDDLKEKVYSFLKDKGLLDESN